MSARRPPQVRPPCTNPGPPLSRPAPFPKATTLPGGLPGGNVALYPHPPTVARDQPSAAAAWAGPPAPAASSRPGPAVCRLRTPGRNEPAAGASGREGLGLSSRHPEAKAHGFSAGVGRCWSPHLHLNSQKRDGLEGKPNAGRGRPPRCRERGELQPQPRPAPRAFLGS